MNIYRYKDEKGRKLVIDKIRKAYPNINWEISGATDDFEPIDIVLDATSKKTGKKRTYYIEVKYRNGYKYTDFEDSILEVSKVKGIIDKYNGKNILYCVYWEDGVLEIFNITDIDQKIKPITKKMRKNNVTYEKVDKLVYLLPHNLAKITLF